MNPREEALLATIAAAPEDDAPRHPRRALPRDYTLARIAQK